MKVLHVGPKNYPPNHGGVEKIVFDLVGSMKDVESHVFTQWDSNPSNGRVRTLRRGVIASLKQVTRYCREQGIDIVHLHKENFVPLTLLLRLQGIRCVLTIHGCGWRLKRWALYFRVPIFLLDCLACLLVARVVFVGERDCSFFQRLFRFRRLHLIRNGITVNGTVRAEAEGGMVYLGRLSPEKNIVDMIETAEASGIQLDLYGPFDRHDPQFQEAVLNRLKDCDHVRWHGPVPFDQVRRTLSKYRCFVNLSHSEGLPVSVLEAAAEGLYLVLSDIPQHRLLGFPECRYVDPNKVCFEGLDMDRLSGAANREHARKEFRAEKMVHSYLAIYEDLL